MWVDSKTAADVFGVKYDALVKSVKRAEKQGKKFCTIKPNILSFIYVKGIGRGGKVLQIWLDEQSENKLINKGYNIEDIKHTRTSRAFAKQGLCCNPVSAQWQGEYKSSKDWQEDTTKETSPQPKSHKGSINDEKYNWDEQRRASGDCCSYERDEYSGDWGDSKSTNIAKCDKTSYETQEESLDKSSQNSAITDIRALKVQGSP
ncbi:hypothetical protein CX801_09320, partial [Campylobacter fetus]|nr:hypothetical protein [Campylobacter fetus]